MNLVLEAPHAAARRARLLYLFRGSARPADHPLWALVANHRGVERPDDDESPASAAPSPTARPTTPAAALDVASVRQRVAGLPALPAAVSSLMRLLEDQRISVEQCAEQLGRDQALTARTLRIANSTFYGVSGRVGSIHDAINLIGLRALRSVVTTAAVSMQFSPPTCEGFGFNGFWRHSMATACAARGIAAALRLDDEIAYTAGLLHDVGRLALAAHFPRPCAAVLQATREPGASAGAIERSLLGLDHAAVGAAVAEHWHFPAAVIDAIAHHHAPHDGGETVSVNDVVHVADALAHALDLGSDSAERVPVFHLPAWGRVERHAPAWADLLAPIESEVAATCAALGL